MYIIILSFLTAFMLTYVAIPPIIHIAQVKHLYDEPNDRSSHTVRTPSLGGIAIFAGAIFAIVLWTPLNDFSNLQYILGAFIILFLIGAKDDIMPMSATKKLVAQVLAASILILKSDIRLEGFYGLFGLHEELGYVFSFGLSLLTLLVIINAFNLLDGINGLAASVGGLIAATLGCWFFLVQQLEYATVAFATVGALVAFLKYNFTPARIFMGDTGSLIIGLVSAILIVRFIDLSYQLAPGHPYKLDNIPAVAIGIMILPLFDTLRVFIARILRGQSPLHPDRRHIHHLLIDCGFSHMQATGVLFLTNICFIALVFSLHQELNIHVLLLLVLGLAAALTYWLQKEVLRKKFRRSTL